MSKLSTLIAAGLLALAGSASANTIWSTTDSTAKTINSGTDKTTAYTIPTVSEANGVMISFSFTYTGGTLQNNDFLAMYFGSSTQPNFGMKVNGGDGSTTNDLFGRMGGTAGTYLSNTNLVAGTTYDMVGWLSKSGNSSGDYNRLEVWLNPTDTEVATLTGADITINGDAGFSSLTSVGFRTTNIDTATVTINDIEVSAVPEPATLSLMGLAAAGLGFARRRKKA